MATPMNQKYHNKNFLFRKKRGNGNNRYLRRGGEIGGLVMGGRGVGLGVGVGVRVSVGVVEAIGRLKRRRGR